MMQTLHDRFQGWIAKIILGLLIIPFSLWGIQSMLDSNSKVVVAYRQRPGHRTRRISGSVDGDSQPGPAVDGFGI
ncbi:MAG: SurA N-terminal domain-containing protein [Gammaproteobacteria bacterium]|nr:SurA N-terminal domain-containing protein [Gammaproteobacteria bacterium]